MKVFLIVAAAVVVLLVALMLIVGDQHGPGRHQSATGLPTHELTSPVLTRTLTEPR